MPDNVDLVGVGELLWDCFADRRLPGGAPANVVFHASRLGLAASVCSRIGNDSPGSELREFLLSRGLSVDLVQVDPDRPTGTVTVDTTDPAQPRFAIHENVAWDALEFPDALRQAVEQASALCVGTLAQRSAASRLTISRCLEAAADALVVYDVNLRPPYVDPDWIRATLERSSVVKLNIDELTQLAEPLAPGPGEPVRVARRMLDRYERLRIVCITRAAEGCLLVADDESIDVPGEPVELADAVGAGDAFTAALIAAQLRGWPLPITARFANRVGALVASRAGAMPELGDELGALIGRTETEIRD